MEIIGQDIDRLTGDLRSKERQRATSFGHPVAEKTEWVELEYNGSNVRSYYLKQNSKGQLKVVRSIRATVFFFLFALAGYALISWAVGNALGYLAGPDLKIVNVIVGLAGLFFTFIGAGSFIYDPRLVFDRQHGLCWEGRTMVTDTRIRNTSNSVKKMIVKALPLNRIKALQILMKSVRSSTGFYNCYELNLILDEGARLNVLNHAKLNHLRTDASKLADYLNVPVFDAVDFQKRE